MELEVHIFDCSNDSRAEKINCAFQEMENWLSNKIIDGGKKIKGSFDVDNT